MNTTSRLPRSQLAVSQGEADETEAKQAQGRQKQQGAERRAARRRGRRWGNFPRRLCCPCAWRERNELCRWRPRSPHRRRCCARGVDRRSTNQDVNRRALLLVGTRASRRDEKQSAQLV